MGYIIEKIKKGMKHPSMVSGKLYHAILCKLVPDEETYVKWEYWWGLGKFHNLDIIWITDFVFWNDPSTYTCFNGIKRLGLPNTLQDRADENGVDWYDAWPELEEMEIYETNEKGDIVK